MKARIPERTVERLSQYRRLLHKASELGMTTVFSHQLAEMAGATAVLVRRDLMTLGPRPGRPKRGYDVASLSQQLAAFLDAPDGLKVALIGVGNLGSALLPYFVIYRPNLHIVAAFDTSPRIYGRLQHGCMCHDVRKMETVINAMQVRIAILAIPPAPAQEMVDRLVATGIRGILNFAPTHLKAPAEVWVEQIDLGAAMEKVAFMAQQPLAAPKEVSA